MFLTLTLPTVERHDYFVESNVLSKEGHDDTAFWRYNGYETLDSMYSDAVTRNIEDYNHQDNVKS